MDTLNKLLEFKHYEIIAIPLLFFVILASGIFKKIKGDFSKEIHTRELYPELIDIYRKYFDMGRGFNPVGSVLANEPIFVKKGSAIVSGYRITFPYNLLNLNILFTGASFAGAIFSLFLFTKNKASFLFVVFFIVLSTILLYFQSRLKINIKRAISDLNTETKMFLESKKLSIDDVYTPKAYEIERMVDQSLWLNIFASLLSSALLFVFYFSDF